MVRLGYKMETFISKAFMCSSLKFVSLSGVKVARKASI